MSSIIQWLGKKNISISNWVKQMIKFSSVGVLNTIVDAVVYLILTRWLGFSGMEVTAKAISYCAGILNSYIWNKNWTFRSSTGVSKTLIPFVITNLIGLAINTGMMQLGLNQLHFHDLLAFIFASGFTIIWNFLMSKFFVFRK